MYEISVILATILLLVSGTYYAYLAWTGAIKPVPATWVLMLGMMSLSCWMYAQSPNRSWTSNVSVTVGVLNLSIILAGVIMGNVRRGTLRVAFTARQKYCLLAGVMIAVLWYCVDAPKMCYALVQCIALVAYVATVEALWNATSSTEPVSVWVAILIASLTSIYPAWTKHDVFAWIYLARAIPSLSLMIALIVRVNRRLIA